MVKTSKDLSKAVAAAAEAEQAAARQRDSPEKKQARMDELEERARLFGDSVKQSYNAKCIERKWLRFLLVHGDEIGFKASIGPTVKQVERFVTYCFCTRDVVSAIGREGVGDSYELQIRYMLAKFVFVSLGYKGWTKLSPHELHEKAEPYKFAVRGQWKRLKRSDPELMSTLKPFVKTKWCDIAYFLAQVRALRTVVGIESSEDEAETFVPACTWQDHCMARVNSVLGFEKSSPGIV